MVKIILYVAASLDGYIARATGDVDWLPTSADSGYGKFYKSIDTVIMGNKTYEQILTFGKYPYKEKKSFVFSRDRSKTKDGDVEFVYDVEEFAQKSPWNSKKKYLAGWRL